MLMFRSSRCRCRAVHVDPACHGSDWTAGYGGIADCSGTDTPIHIRIRMNFEDTEDLASYDFSFHRLTSAVMRCLAVGLLVGLFIANVYRAATQSLTIDEAFTYNLYLSKNLRTILTEFDANNHVLFTLLAKLSVALFGNGEFAIRLPSLFGGLIYFYAVYRVCWFFFPDRWLFVAGVAALTLNPFVLDFLSAARGYGLGHRSMDAWDLVSVERPARTSRHFFWAGGCGEPDPAVSLRGCRSCLLP